MRYVAYSLQFNGFLSVLNFERESRDAVRHFSMNLIRHVKSVPHDG